MKNFNRDTNWFAVKCSDRNEILEFLNFRGEEIDWESGVDNMIGTDWLMVSSPIKNWILLCGSNIAEIAFKNLEEFDSYKDYIEKTKHIVEFLNTLSEKFSEAYYFLTHDHHVINSGYFQSLSGQLKAGLINVDSTITEFVENNPFDENNDILEIAGVWTINPDIIYDDIDYNQLTWIKKEKESFFKQMFMKRLMKY